MPTVPLNPAVETVIVLLPPGDTGLGEKLTAAPGGALIALRVTASLKPWTDPTFTANTASLP